MILPLRLIFVVDFFTEANKPRLPQWMLRHWIKVLFELDFFYIHQKWNTLLGNSAYHIYILSISAFLSTLILKSTGPYLGYGTCPGTNDYMDLLFHARFLHWTGPVLFRIRVLRNAEIDNIYIWYAELPSKVFHFWWM
jgi:hypothetical protein